MTTLHAAFRIGGYVVRCHGPEACQRRVKVRGRWQWFDFDERFGPLLTDRHGEPLKAQPITENHAFWKPFEAWLRTYEQDKWRKANPQGPRKPRRKKVAPVA